ncbi:MAG: rubredoxin [Gammaproteobacteria bacterium]|nr:rubredoxin [Gammaproteobacteria bacterium]
MTTNYRCPGCGYVYDPRYGDPHEGFPAGTPWSEIPEDWACPDCAVREKPDFVAEQQPAADS